MSKPLSWFASAAAALTLGITSCSLFTDTPPPPAVEDPQASLPGDRLATSQGNLVIHPLNHATFMMNWAGRTLYVDPVGGAERFQGLPSPDILLVTDLHGDHYSADTLAAVLQPATVIIAPRAVRDLMPANLQAVTQELANGGTLPVKDIPIEAIPMYNITPDRLERHVKGRGNGYLLTLGDKRVYIAGDTEDTPEMRALSNIDVAFVPMNLPFTMSVQQAADAVRAVKPRIVYPYHSRGSDVNEFARLVGTDVGVEVRLRTWY
jgi:L-ascorbate metabolism protein UlaG (beta-lactamase superfamily)